MQYKSPRFLIVPLLFAATLFNPVFAEEEMDVDLSDSLDFEAFHTDKKAAVKLWDKKNIEKTYETTDEAKTASGAVGGKTDIESQSVTAQPARTAAEEKKGKRYEIRELYSISGSERTGYNPSTVVQALYLQMQGLCPNGWKKLDERSEPDGSDAFYMYYSFECL